MGLFKKAKQAWQKKFWEPSELVWEEGNIPGTVIDEYREDLESSPKRVRRMMRGDDPWWVGIDVCKITGHKNPHDALSMLDEDEKDYLGVSDAMGRDRETIIINLAGLFTLVLRSNLPEAKKFRRWVTHEVLPSIYKTGKYDPTPRLKKAQKECKCDERTARYRLETKKVHNDHRQHILDAGGSVNDIIASHDAHWNGLGFDGAKGAREAVNLPDWKTAHDRSEAAVLTLAMHAKAILYQKVEEAHRNGKNMTQSEIAAFQEETTRRFLAESLVQLGNEHVMGIKEDLKRGLVLGLIPKQITVN